MTKLTPREAVAHHRERQAAMGLARFEVRGLEADKPLLRDLAQRLARGGAEAKRLREDVKRTVSGAGGAKGGILAALRASPLVGVDLTIEREQTSGRAVDL
ncbi:MAG: hypothetical protein ACXW3D_01075 [Caulobacteraceae bacterium]